MEKLKELKLHGMLKGLQEQQESTNMQQLSFEERLGLLVDIESLERENRQLKTRLKQAAFRQNACIQDIDYSLPRKMDQSLMQSLYCCQWIKDSLNVIMTGPTGVGKSFIACALGHQACMKGYRVKYLKLSRFLPQLAIARADGTYLKMIQQLTKVDLIIFDDWGLSVLNSQERHDMLEIIDDRHNRSSTLITSQIPQSEWFQVIGDPTLADAILDRIIYNAYTIELKAGSVRKKLSKLNNSNN